MPPAKECIRLTAFLLEAFTCSPFVWTSQNPNTKPPPTILSNIFTYSSFLWHPKNGYTQPPISPFTKAPGYSFFYVIPKVYTLFLHNQNLHILHFSLFLSKSTFTTSHFPSSKSSHTPIVYALPKSKYCSFVSNHLNLHKIKFYMASLRCIQIFISTLAPLTPTNNINM